jgi:hypothetical protein
MPTLRPSSSCLNRCKDQAGLCTSSLLFLAIFFDPDLHLLQQLASSSSSVADTKSDLEEYKKETCLRGACFAYVRNDGGEQQSSHEQESSGKSSEESGEDAQQAKCQRLHSMWKRRRRILSWLPTMAT